MGTGSMNINTDPGSSRVVDLDKVSSNRSGQVNTMVIGGSTSHPDLHGPSMHILWSPAWTHVVTQSLSIRVAFGSDTGHGYHHRP